jgi:hypothetical protein
VICSQHVETLPEGLVYEVWASIINHDSWNTKARKYDFLKHPLWILRVGCNTGKCFNPFGHIVHGHQDILTWRLLFSGIASRALIFPCFWYLGHHRTNSLASRNMVGQKNPLF